jgi:hypothetical protein
LDGFQRPDTKFQDHTWHGASVVPTSKVCISSLFILMRVPGEGWACGSIVGWGTMLQARRSQVWFTTRSLDFLVDLTLPATLWPWGQLSLWQKWVPGIFLGVKVCQHVRVTTSTSSVRWLPRKCGSLDVSHSFGSPWPVTGIALNFLPYQVDYYKSGLALIVWCSYIPL